MTRFQAPLHAFQDSSFEGASSESHEDVLKLACEVELKEEREQLSGEAEAASNEEGPVGQEICQIENYCTNEEDRIAQKLNLESKRWLLPNLRTMVEESLDDVLRMLFHNAQSGIWSFIYKVVEQIIM